MRLLVDVSGVTFTVGHAPEPRMESGNTGVQRRDRMSNVPMWTVQLIAIDEAGAEVIKVTVVAPEAPKLSVGQPVIPVGLEAIPWAQNGKNGTAFRATELKPVSGVKSVPTAS